ncbi:unnamed protein product [Fusarium graminearum]|nr:unnamed protein product [Fusarium graminearum]
MLTPQPDYVAFHPSAWKNQTSLEILQLHQVWRRRALRISEGGATEGYDYYLRLCDVERARWPEPCWFD